MAKKTVLVCDDEPNIIESITYIVGKLGHHLEIAVNGEQALHRARQLMPDLMILDVRMPRLSGDEVCRMLKSDAATRGIYIIILTAFGQARDQNLIAAAGADEFMTKPFSPRSFREKLSRLLGPAEDAA